MASRFPRAPGMVEGNAPDVQPKLTLQSLDAKCQEMRDMIEDLVKLVALLSMEVRMQRRALGPTCDFPITRGFTHECDDIRYTSSGASSKVQRRGHPKYKSSKRTTSPPGRAPMGSAKMPKPRRAFTDLRCPQSAIFIMLQRRGLLAPLPPPMGPRPTVKFPDRKCAYHQVTGHDTDYCGALRCKIQDLIDAKLIPKPNVETNPLPEHGINHIEAGDVKVPSEPRIAVAVVLSASPSLDDPIAEDPQGAKLRSKRKSL